MSRFRTVLQNDPSQEGGRALPCHTVTVESGTGLVLCLSYSFLKFFFKFILDDFSFSFFSLTYIKYTCSND